MPNKINFGGNTGSYGKINIGGGVAPELSRINTFSGCADYSANRNNVTIADDIKYGFFMLSDSNTNTDGTKESDLHINSLTAGTITKVYYGRAKHNWSDNYNTCWIYTLENVPSGAVLKFTIGDNNGMHVPMCYSIFKIS